MWEFIKQLFDFNNWSTMTFLEQSIKIFKVLVFVLLVLAVLGILTKIIRLIIGLIRLFQK